MNLDIPYSDHEFFLHIKMSFKIGRNAFLSLKLSFMSFNDLEQGWRSPNENHISVPTGNSITGIGKKKFEFFQVH